MKRFEYKVTRHGAEQFESLVYFCNEDGDCKLREVPADQAEALEKVLNEQGDNGWELVDTAFGKDGVVAFWKRKVS